MSIFCLCVLARNLLRLCVTGENHFLESKKLMCYGSENEIAAVTFFAKTSTALTNRSAFASPTEWQDPGNTVAASMSPAPPACCPSLPKHYVVWNCLGVVVAGFPRRGVGEVLILLRHCWRDAFSAFALAVERLVTIGRGTAQFCFGLLMRFGLPSLRPSRLLTHAIRRALCLAGTWEQIGSFWEDDGRTLVATCLGTPARVEIWCPILDLSKHMWLEANGATGSEMSMQTMEVSTTVQTRLFHAEWHSHQWNSFSFSSKGRWEAFGWTVQVMSCRKTSLMWQCVWDAAGLKSRGQVLFQTRTAVCNREWVSGEALWFWTCFCPMMKAWKHEDVSVTAGFW